MKIIKYIVTFIFYILLSPVRWYKSFIYNVRLENAKAEAENLTKETGKKAFVIQNGMHFQVGYRKGLRQVNIKMRKKIKELDGSLMYNYKNAIVYETK